MTKKILELDGKALEEEIQHIIETSPIRKQKTWTVKELVVARRLAEAGVSQKKIALLLGRSMDSVNSKLKRL
jgi:DNA-binding NarL/FixJ family response regulator